MKFREESETDDEYCWNPQKHKKLPLKNRIWVLQVAIKLKFREESENDDENRWNPQKQQKNYKTKIQKNPKKYMKIWSYHLEPYISSIPFPSIWSSGLESCKQRSTSFELNFCRTKTRHRETEPLIKI